jgi:hypothetical protein
MRKHVIRTATAALLLGTAVIHAPAAHATSTTTLRVCASGCDHASLQAALTAANPGDTIEVATGVYSESLTINISLAIRGGFVSSPGWGPGPAGSRTVIRGDKSSSVLTIGGSETVPSIVSLDRLQIENGQGRPSGGGILARFVALSLSDSVVASNSTTATIENDSAFGGGLYLEAGSLNIDRSQFLNNIVSCNGLYCPITDGGAIFITGTQQATISATEFSNNYGWVGAGIASKNATLTVRNASFQNNSGAYGAAVHSTNSVVTVTSSTMLDNNGSQGGVLRSSSDVSALYAQNQILNNQSGRAIVEAFAADASVSNRLTLVNNALLGNRLTYSNTGSALIVAATAESLIAHNTVAASQLLAPEQPLLRLAVGSTGHMISNNIFVSATVGITASAGTSFTLQNTIMDRIVTPVGGEAPVISATLILTNPLLVNENNDARLRAGSPAINAGSIGLTNDLAGRPRDAQPDIGAYEYVNVRLLFLPLTQRQ